MSGASTATATATDTATTVAPSGADPQHRHHHRCDHPPLPPLGVIGRDHPSPPSSPLHRENTTRWL